MNGETSFESVSLHIYLLVLRTLQLTCSDLLAALFSLLSFLVGSFDDFLTTSSLLSFHFFAFATHHRVPSVPIKLFAIWKGNGFEFLHPFKLSLELFLVNDIFEVDIGELFKNFLIIEFVDINLGLLLRLELQDLSALLLLLSHKLLNSFAILFLSFLFGVFSVRVRLEVVIHLWLEGGACHLLGNNILFPLLLLLSTLLLFQYVLFLLVLLFFALLYTLDFLLAPSVYLIELLYLFWHFFSFIPLYLCRVLRVQTVAYLKFCSWFLYLSFLFSFLEDLLVRLL
mgnify:FL=1